ncbi:hypothetical protein KKC22_04755 [Myxococcota bacterium]|nr:hypothetical protein [Myxococcota bacterium]
MYKPPFQSSSRKFLSYGVYHQVRLEATPRTAPLAGAMEVANRDVKTAALAVEEADWQVMRALALRDAADSGLDAGISAFGRALLDHFGGDRGSALYQRLLPHGVSGINAAPPATEVKLVETLAAALAEAGLPDALRAHGPVLIAAAQQLAAAIAGYEKAVRERTLKTGDLQLAKDGWITAYTRSYGALVQTFGSKAMAETFFKAAATASAQDEPAPTPAEN